ncbi:MAG: hypothetical protein HYS18_10680 [Burkholderiales bacterium]|nr:hypothetical protein [Burkholderiales bacterium]
MIKRTLIRIHAEAPSKPRVGMPCNGCGVCCMVELCPLARLRFLRFKGPCPALRWREEDGRYVCGMLADARHPLIRLWVRRYIAAGIGCDSTYELD